MAILAVRCSEKNSYWTFGLYMVDDTIPEKANVTIHVGLELAV